MISKLHYITQELAGYSHSALAEQACIAGVDWVQLRIKNKTYDEQIIIANKTAEICKKYNAKLIINDNVKLAKEINADGVHLGKTDMEPAEARKILGNGFIIGGTANTFEDISRLVQSGVEYIGLGPFRFTSTKENLSPILGIEGYKNIMKKCRGEGINIPIISIGGIKSEDVMTLMETGIHGVAVSSAINMSNNKKNTVEKFRDSLMLKS
jgi:thiamine-phosphate pyrophosphorylase